jgi:hypothetical protein
MMTCILDRTRSDVCCRDSHLALYNLQNLAEIRRCHCWYYSFRNCVVAATEHTVGPNPCCSILLLVAAAAANSQKPMWACFRGFCLSSAQCLPCCWYLLLQCYFRFEQALCNEPAVCSSGSICHCAGGAGRHPNSQVICKGGPHRTQVSAHQVVAVQCLCRCAMIILPAALRCVAMLILLVCVCIVPSTWLECMASVWPPSQRRTIWYASEHPSLFRIAGHAYCTDSAANATPTCQQRMTTTYASERPMFVNFDISCLCRLWQLVAVALLSLLVCAAAAACVMSERCL